MTNRVQRRMVRNQRMGGRELPVGRYCCGARINDVDQVSHDHILTSIASGSEV